MKQMERLQETRKMRFEEACKSYKKGSLTQEEAASILAYVTVRSVVIWPNMTGWFGHNKPVAREN
ncbi:hypothetical protein SAMN05421690_1003106 [Nitrosomonas sp. Nm51]|nr:hypothetical protein SAMN05421690_1003106 [Nitrosomonas sp. Nm51]